MKINITRLILLGVILFSFSSKSNELVDIAKNKGIELNKEEIEVLDVGELGVPAYVLGGLIGTYPGFGIGHALQGRWSSKGWIFTVGEFVTGVILVMSAADCLVDTVSGNPDCESRFYLTASAAGLIGLKVWEIFDVWYGGHQQRKKYKSLKDKIQSKNFITKYKPFIKPQFSTDSASLQIGMSF